MLDIDKEVLKERFNKGDLNYVFKNADKIAGFIISSKYKIFDYDTANDIKQECLLNLFKKICDDKVNGDKNIFSFIWKNSNFRILEILRKERNREKIASFVPYETMDYEVNKKSDVVYRYEE
jgi:DNA-directed RNA polymerase specialized sigma24 family protein